jgi:hypothetical protein
MLRNVRVSAALGAVALMMAVPAVPAAAQEEQPGLTGGFRSLFVQAGVQACMQLTDDPRLADLPRDLVEPSCTCVTNQVADRLRASEAQRLLMTLLAGGRFDQPQDIELAQTVLVGSAVACVGELGLAPRPR